MRFTVWLIWKLQWSAGIIYLPQVTIVIKCISIPFMILYRFMTRHVIRYQSILIWKQTAESYKYIIHNSLGMERFWGASPSWLGCDELGIPFSFFVLPVVIAFLWNDPSVIMCSWGKWKLWCLETEWSIIRWFLARRPHCSL